jgi:RNA polymerase sigma-70 factor (ECF subfamily)
LALAVGTVAVDDNLLATTVAAVAGTGGRAHDIASGVTNAMLYAKLRVWAAVPVLAGLAAVPFAGWGGARAVPPVAVALTQAATVPAANAAVQDEKSVADAPPVVVKTVPEAGTTDVDPDIKEIKVTFSKEMGLKSWSWATDGRYGKTIEAADKVHFDKDKKTCVLPCKLEPGTTYAVWINAQQFNSFRDTDGRPSVPYLLVFQTKKK